MIGLERGLYSDDEIWLPNVHFRHQLHSSSALADTGRHRPYKRVLRIANWRARHCANSGAMRLSCGQRLQQQLSVLPVSNVHQHNPAAVPGQTCNKHLHRKVNKSLLVQSVAFCSGLMPFSAHDYGLFAGTAQGATYFTHKEEVGTSAVGSSECPTLCVTCNETLKRPL